ncbi:MAG: dynamin family protein [Acidobacteria bacterium]|nr:dynamin family protein [Acidobacteriota bacterium]
MKPLTELFQEISKISEELQQERFSSKINDALSNYQEGRFIVAAVGEFKRGKSSLLNALLSKKIFPVGALPLTSVITVAQYCDKDEVYIYFEDGTHKNITLSQLEDFVTEKGNSGNKLKVRVALIKTPLEFLSSGIKLVDTPGIGSVIEKNSEVTKKFVPAIDVALVVSGYEPPLTSDELKLITEVEKEASNIVIVLNKSDIPDEKTKKEVEKFTLNVLEQKGIKNSEFFSVSANTKKDLSAENQIDKLRDFLLDMAKSSSKTIIEESAKRNLLKFSAELLQFVEIEIFSLTEPSISLEKKIKEFQDKISDLDIWILAAKTKAIESFKIDSGAFEEAKRNIEYEAFDELKRLEIPKMPKIKFRKAIKEKTRLIAKAFSKKYSENTHSLIEEIEAKRETALKREFEEIGKRIKKAGAESFGITQMDFEIETFQSNKKKVIFEFVEKKSALELSDFIFSVVDLILPKSFVFDSALAEGGRLLKEWMRENFGRISEATVEELDEMTRKQAAFFEEKLKETAREIESAIEEGIKKKKKGEESVRSEIDKLTEIKKRLTDIKSSLERNE